MKIRKLTEEIEQCTNCDLCKTRNKVVIGEGAVGARIMFLGEAPGRVNDECGRPFVGHGGKIFDKILDLVGLDRKEVFITNVVKCWPPENRKPKKVEIDACNSFLIKQIEEVNPDIIVALGAVAFETLTNKKVKVKENCGKVFEEDGKSYKVGLSIHPNAVRYVKGGVFSLADDIKNILRG